MRVRESNARMGGEDADGRGAIYVLRADLLSENEQALLLTAARVVIACRQGDLSAHLAMRPRDSVPHVRPPVRVARSTSTVPLPPPLQFSNGLGGFTDSGREYAVVLNRGQRTPAPWINIVANDGFGFQVIRVRSGYTWSVNSRENQLTPWSNDPVSDPAGEAFYFATGTRALDAGRAADTRRGSQLHIVLHGHGYVRFEHRSNGIESTWPFVPPKIRSRSRGSGSSIARAKRAASSITAYVEWVLGVFARSNGPFVVTEVDSETGGCSRAIRGIGSSAADRLRGLARRRQLDRRSAGVPRAQRHLDPPARSRRADSPGAMGAGIRSLRALQRDVSCEPGRHRSIWSSCSARRRGRAARSLARNIAPPTVPRRRSADSAGAVARASRPLQVQTPDPRWT